MQSFKKQFSSMNGLMYEISVVKNKNRFPDEDEQKYSIAGRGRRREIKEAKRFTNRATRLAIKRLSSEEIQEVIN